MKKVPIIEVKDENKLIKKAIKSGKCPKCGGKMSWKSNKLYGYYDVMGSEHHFSCDSCMWIADSYVDI